MQFLVSSGPFICESMLDALNIEKQMSRYNLHNYDDHFPFDIKDYIKNNLKLGQGFFHLPTVEDYWVDFFDEFEVRRIN